MKRKLLINPVSSVTEINAKSQLRVVWEVPFNQLLKLFTELESTAVYTKMCIRFHDIFYTKRLK